MKQFIFTQPAKKEDRSGRQILSTAGLGAFLGLVIGGTMEFVFFGAFIAIIWLLCFDCGEE